MYRKVNLNLLGLTFHQDQISSRQNLNYGEKNFWMSRNYSTSIRATQRRYMDFPYGQCNSYEGDGQPFNASSQTQCYRNCIREYSEKHYKCKPLFIDYFIHENDFKGQNENKFCSLKENLLFEKWLKETKFEEKCRSLCPKNCIQTQYFWETKEFNKYNGNEWWWRQGNDHYWANFIIWDTTQPMFAYIEEPVMTFTDYLVYCGGLIGLWFGTSAKDLLISLLNAVLNNFNRLTGTNLSRVVPFNQNI